MRVRARSMSALASLVALGLLPVAAAAQAMDPARQAESTPAVEDSGLTLWYDEPAEDWEREALPIGNGALGAKVFGGVGEERIQLNEKTLWTGGPGAVEEGHAYNYGNWEEPRPGALQDVRRRIAAEESVDKDWVANKLAQHEWGFGAYQPFGNLRLDFAGQLDADGVTNYRRELDIGDAVAGVSFTAEGTTFTREYFASYPHDVVVVRLTADRQESVSFTTSFDSPHDGKQVTATDGRITIRGELPDNGLVYEGQLQVIADGGEVSDGDGTVTVDDADAATLVFSAGTNYADEYPAYRDVDPHAEVTGDVDVAAATPYPQLRRRHVEDYTALFDRVRLDLDQEMPPVPTDELLAGYDGSGPADRGLERLFFFYGRYLLIESSRPGSLPANLQGVWNDSTSPPWDADYHVNINLQMNYWPAEVTNLTETTAPLFAYADALREPGRVSAHQIYGVDQGWVVGNQTNPWGFTGVHDYAGSFWFPEAGAWLAQHFFEHYRFTGDTGFLRETAYPYMKETAQFWLDFLVEDPRDGQLVVTPSYSPEHGPFSAGAAMSQQIVWDLLTNTIAASRRLGIDAEFRARLIDTKQRLDPGLRVGSWGQLQEWKADWDDPSDTHRHVSHLFALHPGRQISPRTTPGFAEAAEVSLRARGDGGTGWSKAWKINFWARLLDGDHAHKMLSEQLQHSTLPNLWDTHPPFQIDGNFGATSGVAEMLLQSHLGTVDVLPALPSQWRSGSVDGLRARGGYTVGATWDDGAAREIRIAADDDTRVRVRNQMITDGPVKVVDEDGRTVPHRVAGGTLEVPIDAGQTYRIIAQGSLSMTVPDGVVEPGTEVPATVTLAAVDETTIPQTDVSVDAPTGWSVQPASVDVPPLQPGEQRTEKFVITVPEGVGDGEYTVTATAQRGRWQLTAQTPVVVERFNAALRSDATQSSTAFGAPASRAVDGDTNGAWSNGSVTHTAFQPQPWWQTDLGESYPVSEIAVWNRTDCCSERLSDYYVMVSDEPFTSDSLAETLAQPGVSATHLEGTAGSPTVVELDRTARYVRIQLSDDTGDVPLSLAEVQVFTD